MASLEVDPRYRDIGPVAGDNIVAHFAFENGVVGWAEFYRSPGGLPSGSGPRLLQGTEGILAIKPGGEMGLGVFHYPAPSTTPTPPRRGSASPDRRGDEPPRPGVAVHADHPLDRRDGALPRGGPRTHLGRSCGPGGTRDDPGGLQLPLLRHAGYPATGRPQTRTPERPESARLTSKPPSSHSWRRNTCDSQPSGTPTPTLALVHQEQVLKPQRGGGRAVAGLEGHDLEPGRCDRYGHPGRRRRHHQGVTCRRAMWWRLKSRGSVRSATMWSPRRRSARLHEPAVGRGPAPVRLRGHRAPAQLRLSADPGPAAWRPDHRSLDDGGRILPALRDLPRHDDVEALLEREAFDAAVVTVARTGHPRCWCAWPWPESTYCATSRCAAMPTR